MELTDIEKGYIAGILDGEGTITLTRIKANEYRAPVVSVTSTTIEILEYLQERCGGSISQQAKKEEHHKDSWSWKIIRNKAIELLEQVSDYLLVPEKKYRADLIISQYKTVTPRNGRYNEERKKLKEKFEEDFFNFITD